MTDTATLHPLTQRIASLRLPGMLAAFQEQMARHDLDDMPFEDRLALLIDREVVERRSRALQRRLKKAQLRHQDACFEDINLTRPRGLSRSVVLGLGDCSWIR
ncbi:MAG: ATP-binding protein, partial [bacterium]|nr:ATP-binding protein [bacterium]